MAEKKEKMRGDVASMYAALAGGPAMFSPQLMGRFGLPAFRDPGTQPEAFDAPWQTYKGMGVSIDKGVAVLEVTGPLGFKLSYWSVGYDELHEVIETRVKPNADALLLNVHSPGGLVSGCFDCADYIYGLDMPVTAVVSDYAASAAYALASSADNIVMTQSAMAGSIGVVMTHFDYSKRMEAMGVGVTYIYAGDDKVLGSPYQELSDDDKAALQAEVDALYSGFVDKVARGRPMTADQIRDTQAGLFLPEEAVKLGLADSIANPHALLAEMQDGVRSGTLVPSTTRMEAIMPTPEGLPASKAELDQLLADAEKKGAAAAATTPEPKGEGASDPAPAIASASDERARIKAIISLDAAKKRPNLAQSLAMDTELDPEAATKVLEAAAEETAGGAGSLASLMGDYDHGISPEGGDETPSPEGTARKLKPLSQVHEEMRKASGHA